MRIQALIAVAGLCVVGGIYLRSRAPEASPRPATIPPRYGHLILHIEGSVRALSIEHITPKPSGYNVVRTQSPYTIELLDGTGTLLGSYPLDLSAFDLAPERVGAELRVEGCQVIDPNIVTLANVPYFETLASLRIRKGADVLGALGSADYFAMLAAGGNR